MRLLASMLNFGPWWSLACGACLLAWTANAIGVPPEASDPTPGPATSVSKLPPLPEAVASFGAALDGHWLYVYGGHTGGAHEHSKKNLSQRFQRLNLAGGDRWEALPMGPPLQGVALVAHQAQIYRIGGMFARNEPGAEEDLVSVADFARFDPRTRAWINLAPLPEPRSSHDAVVVDRTIYVIGGWNLGSIERAWYATSLKIDLGHDSPAWTALPKQPFERRALGIGALGEKIYVVGGLRPMGGPTTEVSVFDTRQERWDEGPALPGKPFGGFGSCVCEVGGRLYATTLDGAIHVLSADGKSWSEAGRLQEPRFLHRQFAWDGQLLVLGGAAQGGHLTSLELVKLPGRSR